MNFIYPLLAIVFSVPVAGGIRYLLEARHRRRIIQLFAQYVPEWVSRELVEGDRARDLVDGRSVRATVIFCDIRAFTALTVALSPSQVRRLLDCYYETLSRLVLEHGGTVLRYVGDEVYAVFGAPLESLDHAATAVTCARDIQRATPTINDLLTESGLPAINYGIGMNTGELISTVVGSDLRRQYAVIGNAVNVGARLCALAGPGEIIVSEATYAELEGSLDLVSATSFTASLKGILGTATLYRLNQVDQEA